MTTLGLLSSTRVVVAALEEAVAVCTRCVERECYVMIMNGSHVCSEDEVTEVLRPNAHMHVSDAAVFVQLSVRPTLMIVDVVRAEKEERWAVCAAVALVVAALACIYLFGVCDKKPVSVRRGRRWYFPTKRACTPPCEPPTAVSTAVPTAVPAVAAAVAPTRPDTGGEWIRVTRRLSSWC